MKSTFWTTIVLCIFMNVSGNFAGHVSIYLSSISLLFDMYVLTLKSRYVNKLLLNTVYCNFKMLLHNYINLLLEPTIVFYSLLGIKRNSKLGSTVWLDIKRTQNCKSNFKRVAHWTFITFRSFHKWVCFAPLPVSATPLRIEYKRKTTLRKLWHIKNYKIVILIM